MKGGREVYVFRYVILTAYTILFAIYLLCRNYIDCCKKKTKLDSVNKRHRESTDHYK